MQAGKVGVREFREKLSGYLDSNHPVAITRHGGTIGFYVPMRKRLKETDLDALHRAAAQLSAILTKPAASGAAPVKERKGLGKK